MAGPEMPWPLPISLDQHIEQLELQLARRIDHAVAAFAGFQMLRDWATAQASAAEQLVEDMGAAALWALIQLVELKAHRTALGLPAFGDKQ